MKRWLHRTLGLIVACGLATGCTKQLFISKECFDQSHELLPTRVEEDLSVADKPMYDRVGSPANLRDPDRPARNLTLREAFALALENGSVNDGGGAGNPNLSANDNLAQFATGAGFNAQTDRIKALALNPAIAGANIEAALSRFDVQYVAAMNWSTTDNLQQTFSSQNGANSTFSSSFVKGLSSGGVVVFGFQGTQRTLSAPQQGTLSFPNPLYETRLNFGFEQPLWRDFGTDINQLLSRFPSFNGTGATSAAAAFNQRQTAGSNLGVGTEGILISRIRVDQQRAEFERRVQNMLLNVEVAYWNLYNAYGQLYSFEEVLRIAHKSWTTSLSKFQSGTINQAVYQPFRGQYEEFRGERIRSLGVVLERERTLRAMLGLPVEDGTRLVPIDAPTLSPFQPNWEAAQEMALHQKPELSIARDNLRTAQLAVVSQKNFLKPDLRFNALYSPIGAGTRLDGNGSFKDGGNVDRPTNALRSLGDATFNEWTVGLTMSVPLGYRLEYAAIRAARLQLAQSYYLLKDHEERTTRSLANQYQKIAEWYQLVEARRAERRAYAESVDARFREFAVGKTTVTDGLLDAQRRLAAAQVKEYEAIAEYNATIARFEWAKGNLLKHNSIVIAEGALPDCVEVKAVDYERERSNAIVLREKADPEKTPGRLASWNVKDLPPRPEVAGPVVRQTTEPTYNAAPSSAVVVPTNPPTGVPSMLPANYNTISDPVPVPVSSTPTFRSVTNVNGVPALGAPTMAPSEAPSINALFTQQGNVPSVPPMTVQPPR